MKIFHISDIHLGLKLNNRDFYEDQKFILNEVVKTAKKLNPDVILIAGDIYNTSIPSAEAVMLFDEFINNLKITLKDVYILIISGNHDSQERVNLYRNILYNDRLFLVGIPPKNSSEFIEKVTLKDEFGNVNFYLLPFVKPHMLSEIFNDETEENLSYNEAITKLILRENLNTNERNIIVSHQFYLPIGKNADEVERSDVESARVGNIDVVNAEVLYDFDYAALGHLHKRMKVGRDYVRYSGTPLQCSVSEAGQEKGLLFVDLKEKGNINIEEVLLKPLRKIIKIEGNLAEILNKTSKDYVNISLVNDEIKSDDMDRIRANFPYLLAINKKSKSDNASKNFLVNNEKIEKNEIEFIEEFLGEISDEERKILTEVLEEIGDEN